MQEKIVNIAQRLKEQFGTNDPVELCRCLGITFVRADLPEKLGGFYMESGGKQAVCVSNALEAPFDRAVAAHEVGHALLHRGLNLIFMCESTNFIPGRYEREADFFSAALLIDRDKAKDGGSIADISRQHGIPLYAVERLLTEV